jgi:hypothetical protein
MAIPERMKLNGGTTQDKGEEVGRRTERREVAVIAIHKSTRRREISIDRLRPPLIKPPAIGKCGFWKKSGQG